MLKAIIFDNDGVIADTEIHRLRHLKRIAEEYSYKPNLSKADIIIDELPQVLSMWRNDND